MLEPCNLDLSIRKQTEILNICRSSFYYKPSIKDDGDSAHLIETIYLQSDCRYGYRKITAALNQQGVTINHKKVLHLMQKIGIQGLFPKRSKHKSSHGSTCIYPYLLEGMIISHPNQVWATDITYLKLQDRFMYFIAIIDIYSRYIIAHELSATLEMGFCIEALELALKKASPHIFNTDQGSHFTSIAFTQLLESHSIKISMDHKGRCFDNIFVERLWRTVKQECIYYYKPETVKELEKCLNQFVIWYNNHRLHQSLNYKTPASFYGGFEHEKTSAS